MKKSTKIAIVIGVFTILTGLVIYGLYFFFGKKDYTFYLNEEIGDIHAVVLHIQDEADAEVDNQEFVIYDSDVIREIMEQMKGVEMVPNYSFHAPEGEKGFSIVLLGENKQQFSFSGSEGRSNYVINLGTEDNGVLEDGIKSLISMTSINKEEGERLYSVVKEILEEEVHVITSADIEKFGKEKIYDWNQWRQYSYTLDKSAQTKTWRTITVDEPARFEINGVEGYLLVWFYDGTVVDENGTNRYAEVLDAVLYNGDGESISIYEEGISSFLEGLR